MQYNETESVRQPIDHTLRSSAIGRMVVGFFARIERPYSGNNIHPSDRWNDLIKFVLLGVQRTLISNGSDAIDPLAVKHADVVTSSYPAIGANAVISIALIPSPNEYI